MHEEDARPPNDKSHAHHFSIAYNGCDFCLLTPPAILALPKCLFKGFVVSLAYDPVLVIAIEIVRYCTKISTKRCKS